MLGIFPIDWDFLWARHQELMKGLSEEWKVLYVEPSFNIPKFLKNIFNKNSYLELRKFFKGVRKISENLYIYKPIEFFPFSLRNKFFNILSQRFLAVMLKPVMKKIKMKMPLLWLSYPKNYRLSNYINYTLLCYDCVDEHSFYHLKKNFFVENLENSLIKKSDFVFASSKKLYNKVRSINENSHFVPNGVDNDFLNFPDKTPEKINNFFNGLKKPVIGYIGALNNWVDYELFEKIISMKSEWSFVIIGPVIPGNEAKFSKIRRKNNVFYVGSKKHFELPFYLCNFDLCIIVYRLNELTESILPIKIFEYFAYGKPVVSTKLPELNEFYGLIQFASSSEEFVEKMEFYLDNITSELIEQMKYTARTNVWKNKIKKIKKIITNT